MVRLLFLFASICLVGCSAEEIHASAAAATPSAAPTLQALPFTLTGRQLAEEVKLGEIDNANQEMLHQLVHSGKYATMAAPIVQKLSPVAKHWYLDEQVIRASISDFEYVGRIERHGARNASEQQLLQNLEKVGKGFSFLIHKSAPDDDPGAHAAYGPNVYIETKLFDFVKNQEQLAGIVCHEVAHAVHHDSYRDTPQPEKERALRLKMLAGARAILANLRSLHHDRIEEKVADLDGATICAHAGINPWGLVWALKLFDTPEYTDRRLVLFRDHPATKTRISYVSNYLEHNPDPNLAALFKRFKKTAPGTPFKKP